MDPWLLLNLVLCSFPTFPGNDTVSGPFLQEDVLSLKGLEFNAEQVEPAEAAPDPVMASPSSPAVPEQKPTNKKSVKPKWLKLWHMI